MARQIRPNYRMDKFTIMQAAESMPIFDPDDAVYCSSGAFVARVRALQRYYGWDNDLVLFAAQQKLCGTAKVWNDSSRILHESLAMFEAKLVATFPDLLTDADIHEQMLSAIRAPGEGLHAFCHRMVAIAQKANLPEKVTVQYIMKRIGHREFSLSIINARVDTITDLYGAVAKYRQVFADSGPSNNTTQHTTTAAARQFDDRTPRAAALTTMAVTKEHTERIPMKREQH